MSEQEKKSGGTARVGSVIMVEKTTSSRHNKPCRPNELHDDSDLHHKRSKAPVVPSEELKHVAENSTAKESTEIEERKECEHAISSVKHKHSVAKKISSSTKKREHSPESITLATLEADKKKPIPPDVQSDTVAKEKEAAKKVSKDDDEDSITDEIKELRTPDVAKEHSEWNTDSPIVKKKGISWNDKEYQDNVILKEIGARSEAWMLDRKASVGPSYRPGMPFEGPSGIMINLPKKSFKSVNQPSGISINVSRKCLVTKSKSNMDDLKKPSEKLNSENLNNSNGKSEPKIANCLSNIREKICNVHSKIRSVFQ